MALRTTRLLSRDTMAAKNFVLVLLALSISAPAAAQPLCELPVSAFLTDSDGAPLTGSVEVELRFYLEDLPASLPAECRSMPTVTLDGGWLRVSVDVCSPPDAGDCGAAAIRDLLDAEGMGAGVWIGVVVGDGPELTPRFPLGAVPYALTAGDAELLAGNPAAAFERTGVAAGLLDTHVVNPDAHHPADSSGIAITPTSVTVGDTQLNDGELDLGPDANDRITAEIAETLTGGGEADALHVHAGGSGTGGSCYTGWGETTCGDGFALMYAGTATFAAMVSTLQGYGAIGSPICVSSTQIASVGGGVSVWNGIQLVGLSNSETRVDTVDATAVTCAVCCQ